MAVEKKDNKGTSLVAAVTKEISRELANEAVMRALLITTFKGLDTTSMKQALLEGMLRGFKFKDFVEKNVYAIPFGSNGVYSLVTSIDYARKVGMRSGVIGKSAPSYTYAENGKLESCTVTIKRLVEGQVGEYSDMVFNEEYNTGKNQWASKPRTMLAKVAEMHALRMACPEELAKAYVEEEMQETTEVVAPVTPEMQETINKINDINELRNFYKENKGLGKAFDKAVTIRKAELEAKDTQGSGPADAGVVQGEGPETDGK